MPTSDADPELRFDSGSVASPHRQQEFISTNYRGALLHSLLSAPRKPVMSNASAGDGASTAAWGGGRLCTVACWCVLAACMRWLIDMRVS